MPLTSGILTFLFTDIEESTRLWDQHPQSMRASLARHDEILRDCIESNQGRIVKTMGDGFFAVFSSTSEAILAVLNCQRRLLVEGKDKTDPIRVRMALHSGEAEIRDKDYYGTQVNRAARLMSLAAGGQVLLSATTVDLAHDHLPEEVSFLDLGWIHLRGFHRPEHVYQLAHPDLPVGFPSLVSIDIVPNNLPEKLASFVGREQEIEEIIGLLDPSSNYSKKVRLLTLTGPGGTGKTRLSLQVARGLLPQFSDGVFFISLAPINDASQVSNAIAVELGLIEQPGLPLSELLGQYLRKKEMLLVLDNFEQVIDAAPLVTRLLSAAPKLTMLVTSRELLQLRGEREYAVSPLKMPSYVPDMSLSELATYEAIALFTQRAQAANPGFSLTKENAAAVVEICARLDGLPLAIELAAARGKLFSPQQMLERLENRLGLLKSGARDLPERQRTLRQTIDWSFKLLSDDEQRLFCRMAVFSGGRTIDAIEAVCAPGLSFDVLDGTESLLNKSLLFQKEGPAGEPRFLMLETIHEYARERLIESGEEEELRDRHLLYFCSLAEEMEPGYRQQDQLLLFDRTEAEWSNFQRSFNWAVENRQFQNAARLVSSLDYFLRYKERVVEGHRWVRRLLLDLEHVPMERRARLMLTASRLELVSGEVAQVNRFALDAMEYAQETGDRQSEAYALLHISVIASLSDRYAEAMKWIEEAEVIFRALGDRPALAETFNARGEVARVAEDFETARLAYEKAFEICRETGEILRTYMIMANLSFIAYNKGDFHLSKKLSVDTLNGWLEIGVRQGIISALWILAGPLSELSEPRKAALLLGAAQASFAEMGAADHPSDLPQVAEYMDRTQAMIGSDEFKKAWDEGQAMSLEQAVAYALED